MRSDPEYKRIQDELIIAGRLIQAAPNNPELIARYQKAQRDAAALQRKYGVIVGEAPASAAPAAGAPDPLGIRK